MAFASSSLPDQTELAVYFGHSRSRSLERTMSP
jgi:hypothetical protein